MERWEIQTGELCFTADVSRPDSGETIIFLRGYPNSCDTWTTMHECLA
jgi:hypothetical protein